MQNAIKQALALVLSLALVSPSHAIVSPGAGMIKSGKAGGVHPGLLTHGLPPGSRVQIWLAHPAEKQEAQEAQDKGTSPKKSITGKKSKKDLESAEGLAGKLQKANTLIKAILGQNAANRSATTGEPAKRVDLWMASGFNKQLAKEEKDALIKELKSVWPHGVQIEILPPGNISGGSGKGREREGDQKINSVLLSKQIGARVPKELLGEWGGKKFDGAKLRLGATPGEGGSVAGSSGQRRTPEEAIAEAKRYPRAAQKGLKISEPDTRPYWQTIRAQAQSAGVDPEVLHAIIEAKGGYNPKKKGGGAYGLMMVSRDAANWVKVTGDLTDPQKNIRAGAQIYAKLLKMFDGNQHRALAAYQAGAGSVIKSGGIPNRKDVRDFLAAFEKAYGGSDAPVRRERVAAAKPVVVPEEQSFYKDAVEKLRYLWQGGPEGTKTFKHTAQWKPILKKYAEEFGMDVSLMEALLSSETDGRRNVTSGKGAKGLMQLMPATSREMGVKDRTDPDQNIRGGIKYFAGLMERFNNNPVLAIAAYNAGPNRRDFKNGNIPNFKETVKHVTRVFDRYEQLTGKKVDFQKHFKGRWARNYSAKLQKKMGDFAMLGAGDASASLAAPSAVPLPRPNPLRTRGSLQAALEDKFEVAPVRYDSTNERCRNGGAPWKGCIRENYMLEPIGVGYRSIRQDRGRFYGTKRLVDGVKYAAGKMAKIPGTKDMAIGDMSQKNGGRISHHKSHQNGTDIDIVYYWTDPNGNPVQATDFSNVIPGKVRTLPDGRRITFDTARNWEMAKHLVENPHMNVQYLFTSSSIKNALLRHAKAIGESSETIKRVGARLNVEGNHANHFHVRVH